MKKYLKIINKLQRKFNINEDHDLKSLVNYSNYKNMPFQNWCNYQEGFSPQILNWFIEHNEITIENGCFLDPFCGSGSSLISARDKGCKVIGIDINPFSCALSKTKLNNYSKNDLKKITEFKIPRNKKVKNLYEKYEFSMTERLFSKDNFNKIKLLKNSIQQVKNKNVQDFLFTTLVSCLEYCSNYKKAGNGLKRKKKQQEIDFFVEFSKKKEIMLRDVKLHQGTSNFSIYNSGVKELDLLVEDNSIDISFFSPPYPNCFDYFEVYKIELWIGEFIQSYNQLKSMRKSAITSNLNANLNQDITGIKSENLSSLLAETLNHLSEKDLWNKKIPKMILLYFFEMDAFMKDLFLKMKMNSKTGIVIGNSSYGGIPILSDLILSEIAEKNGFVVDEIVIARKNETASQQYKNISTLIKYVRESIIILSK